MKKISPSLLSIKKENRLEVANQLFNMNIDWIHYDYMDEKFVPNSAIEISEIENIKNNSKRHIMDIHIMAFEPEKVVDQVIGLVDYATVHYEAFSSENDLQEFINKYKGKIKLGLSIKPNTSFDKITKFLNNIDLLLIMSVEPGKGGQSFIETSLDKIKSARNYIDKNKINILIQVDGGINDKTASGAFKAGADVLVSGSYLTIEPSKSKLDLLLK
ncbi:ribulose-phosphate 3-epimerase [Mesomycoplasma lagogenitalium]|uniref:Ribulose-phosphate 3-epimerase n=1 Tax=Mesomycoplasma lagogenitalium TaxID=171286 RepID=A0ABY8LW71_9BACT|nr:ribulose-phosphate 3-epimerase [Mesomycoplasma lagogenitalium]WGI36543.1 ribulose-phosphate 3-epimerase [Mesomycoplasma lagogenitalium]